MIIGILLIVLGFSWLMYETNFLTVRLQSTAYQKQLAARQTKTEYGNTDMGKDKPNMPEDTEPLKPLEFTPLDMPGTAGSLNIICERG